jgi:hypothetical protein
VHGHLRPLVPRQPLAPPRLPAPEDLFFAAVVHPGRVFPRPSAGQPGPRQGEVAALLSTLSERERQVLTLRFGLDGAGVHTLEEIGSELGVTRERVRQIQDAALTRLRTALLQRATARDWPAAVAQLRETVQEMHDFYAGQDLSNMSL